MYAKLEEDYGLARHAMAVYERATKALPAEEKYEVGWIIIAAFNQHSTLKAIHIGNSCY